jgi:DNA-binding NtrC family response regulator
MDLQIIKQRFSIIGHSPLLNTALETAVKVAPTDMNVLILGESGVGKESFSKIIHHLSARKHAPFIAVNCGAIPEGTIDSELFGHEKGAFTGATDKRKGYFETVSGGTIFLDEVGELPLSTQARLLRILENGEFIKVGSSVVQKTDVRVVAATNRDLLERARQGKFREDLYYRLATVPIRVPKLSERKEDIYLLFRKFASDFAETHHSQLLELSEDAQHMLINYPWPGNVRQLKNVTDQICVLENGPFIHADVIAKYIPHVEPPLPMLLGKMDGTEGMSERDIFYKVLIDMKRDVNDLKKVVFGLLEGNLDARAAAATASAMSSNMPNSMGTSLSVTPNNAVPMAPSFSQPSNYSSESNTMPSSAPNSGQPIIIQAQDHDEDDFQEAISYPISSNLSLEAQEIEMIKKALNKNNGKRKKAADELGISERTLYRKIKQYELE